MTQTLIRVGLALVVLLAVAGAVGIATAEMTPGVDEPHTHGDHHAHDHSDHHGVDRMGDEHHERHTANRTAGDCLRDGQHQPDEQHSQHRTDEQHSQHGVDRQHGQHNQHGQHGAADQRSQHGTQGQHSHTSGPAGSW